MKPFLQVFALGFGGEQTLRILTPHDVLFTFATEMNFLLNYRGWKIEKFFRKERERVLSSTPLYLSDFSKTFILSIHIGNLGTCVIFSGIGGWGRDAGTNQSIF